MNSSKKKEFRNGVGNYTLEREKYIKDWDKQKIEDYLQTQPIQRPKTAKIINPK